MSSLVIVAIPAEDDYVWKISSEKVPHMTILFLGDDATKVKNFAQIANFVEHATEQTLYRQGLEVDHRGTLGADQADVLFFSKARWSGFEAFNDFRSQLLQNDSIKAAYEAAQQFDGPWQPHLTLGYPETPAKPDNRDYPGINYVQFDRIAIWFMDNDGLEFPMKRYEWDMEVSMDGTSGNARAVKRILAHHGVVGMRWGVRRGKGTPSSVSVTPRRKGLKATGGKGFPAHSDAVRAKTLGQIRKKSGVKALSNQDLQSYQQRLQLEQSVKRLDFQNKNAAQRAVATILGNSGKNSLQEVGNAAGSKAAKKAIIRAGLAAA